VTGRRRPMRPEGHPLQRVAFPLPRTHQANRGPILPASTPALPIPRTVVPKMDWSKIWQAVKPYVVKILLALLAGGAAGHLAGGNAGRSAAQAVVGQTR
jgi:hypothetical protein